MNRYHFNLWTNREVFRDLDGTELPDEMAARDHARGVAVDLLANATGRRAWKLSVTDFRGGTCFDLVFATVDDSMDHLTPDLRATVERLCATTASLHETIRLAQTILDQIEIKRARHVQAPYLVARNGERAVAPFVG